MYNWMQWSDGFFTLSASLGPQLDVVQSAALYSVSVARQLHVVEQAFTLSALLNNWMY